MMAGVVLCGGQSRRMGQPKASLPIGNETMLERIVRIMATRCQPIYVIASPKPSLPILPATVEIVCDPAEYLGPLSGLATALGVLQNDCFFLSSCDVPMISSDWIDEMHRAMSDDINAVIPVIGDQLYPLTGIYRSSIRPIVLAMLQNGQRRFKDLFLKIPHRRLSDVDFSDAVRRVQPWRGVNTPEEYRQVTCR
jgi:molybdenum cofactor guanylyltransferase